jgi:competence protein ComEC
MPKYQNVKMFGSIDRIELIKYGRISFLMEADSIITNEWKFKAKEKILCSIYDDDGKINPTYMKLRVGNKIGIIGTLQKPTDERNPGEFNYQKYLSDRDVVAVFSCYRLENMSIISNEISPLKDLVFRIRKGLDNRIQSLHNKTTASLLRGLLLADRRMIDKDINDDFINAGVVHVLAVAGLHVAYVVLIFLFVFNRFNVYARFILTAAGLLFYLIITGANPPVFRSTIMALTMLIAPVSGRDYKSINSLSLAALIILLIDPRQLFDSSFQLSFMAILSLVLSYPWIKRLVDNLDNISKLTKSFLIYCGTSLAIQIGILPFMLIYFQRLSITALISNIVVIPIAGAIIGFGILTLITSTFALWLAAIYASANELLTYLLYSIIHAIGGQRFSYITFSRFSVYDAVVFYSCIIIMFFILTKFITPRAKVTAAFMTVLTMLLVMHFDAYALTPDNVLSVMSIDVGQGDAFYVKFPNGKTALIDAGNITPYFDNGHDLIEPLLKKLGTDKIDYGFISHIDSDHYKGFLSLIRDKHINYIFKPKYDKLLDNDRNLEIYMGKEGIPFSYYSRGKIDIGNVRIYILNDTTNCYFANQVSNNKSGILKIVYGGTSFLFTGDAETKVENDYIAKYGNFLKSTVLKASHHGSKNGTSQKFLEYVKPEYAVISAGILNKYHHPNKEVIDRLNEMHVTILRTDQSGALLLRSDGNKVHTVNWKQIENKFNF